MKYPTNSHRTILSETRSPAFRPDPFVLAVVALLTLVIAGCRAEPTPSPTVVPIPTATYIPSESPTVAISPTPTAMPIRAVVTDTLRVREAPNLSAKILARIKKDATVLLIARSDDNQWFEIEYPPGSGQVAWISSAIVVPDSPTDVLSVGYTSPAPPPGSIYGRIVFRTRFRSGPGKDYDTLDRLAAGARVTILAKSQDGQWFQIIDPRDSSKTAWIALQDQEDTLVEFLGRADQLAIAAAPPTPTPGPTPIPRPTRTPGPPGTVAAGRILMSSNRGGSYAIFAIGENGAIGRALSPFGDSFGPRWSPDGGSIVFYHTVTSSPVATSHIYVMTADGKNLSDLSVGAGGASDSDPDWSPDGRQIVFVRTPRASGPEIWVMNSNGTGARRIVALSPATGIADPGASDFSPHPRWSPDGGRIAYAAVPQTQNPGAPLYPNIFVTGAGGANQTQLTDNDMINANPVWSPDGKQIAWSAKDLFSRQNWKVWAMSSSGGNQRPLISTVGGDANSGVQIAEWIGSRLLLAGWIGNWNVYVSNADGSGIAAITSDSADDRPGDWLP